MPPRTLTKTGALARIAVAALVVLTLFRLAFLAHFEGLGGIASTEVLRSLYLGLKFDLRFIALLLVPAWLLLKAGGTVAGPAWESWPKHRRILLVLGYLVLTIFISIKFDLRLLVLLLAPAWLLESDKGGTPGRRWMLPLNPHLALLLALGLYLALVLVAMVDDVAARPILPAFLVIVGIYRMRFPKDGVAGRPCRWIWAGFTVLVLVPVIFGMFVDFGAYAYIHTRLNGTLLMFLDNPAISGRMMWETYPILRLSALLAAMVGLALWGLRRLAARIGPAAGGRATAAARIAVSVLLVALLWGKWSRYPLRWGEAFEAKRTVLAHTALNPILFFLETRAEMDGGYSLAEVKATHAALADYFGIPKAWDGEGLPSLERTIAPRRQVPGSPNLVFIQLESLAAFKTSPFGNPADPTPYLNRLCAEGILFDRFQVVMENTSRSMFATLFGNPDVSSAQNATRNPLLVDQHTVLAAFPDYRKSFFLGGSANWAQIRAALKNNVKDIQLFEEGSFRSPVVDVWGISDADLLREANEHLRQAKGPFFAYLQTSGNHPPFTIPAHHKDFVRRSLPEDALKRAGFTGNEEYNAVRLMDYALEKYFEAARKEAYFANTVFVLWGDHGIPRGSTDPRFGDLTLAIHQVPFLIYAPGLLKAERRHTIASQLDILPTVASLLGREARTRTLGKDLFDPRFLESSAAFTFTTFRRPPRIGLLQGDHYLNVEPDGRDALYRTDLPDPKDLAAEDPERSRRMHQLARGFHAWAKFLLHHNKPIATAAHR